MNHGNSNSLSLTDIDFQSRLWSNHYCVRKRPSHMKESTSNQNCLKAVSIHILLTYSDQSSVFRFEKAQVCLYNQNVTNPFVCLDKGYNLIQKINYNDIHYWPHNAENLNRNCCCKNYAPKGLHLLTTLLHKLLYSNTKLLAVIGQLSLKTQSRV